MPQEVTDAAIAAGKRAFEAAMMMQGLPDEGAMVRAIYLAMREHDAPDVEALEARAGVLGGQLRQLIAKSRALLACIETHGGIIVPHLLDTDDNPGQFLRDAIEEAQSALEIPHAS